MAAADRNSEGPSEGVLFGVWHVFYDVEVPAVAVLMAAVAVALLAAAGVAFIEWRIMTQSRRATGTRATPLTPRAVMRRTRGVFAGPVTVTVLIPAHNEEVSLPATLESLQAQSRPPERVIVVADNCTDSTVLVAEASGVDVIQTSRTPRKGRRPQPGAQAPAARPR